MNTIKEIYFLKEKLKTDKNKDYQEIITLMELIALNYIGNPSDALNFIREIKKIKKEILD